MNQELIKKVMDEARLRYDEIPNELVSGDILKMVGNKEIEI